MSIRSRDRFLTFRRDKYTCQYCGRKSPEVELECDHRIPKAKGGLDHLSNYVTSCRDCNAGKGAEPAAEPYNLTMKNLSKSEVYQIASLIEEPESVFLKTCMNLGINTVLFE